MGRYTPPIFTCSASGRLNFDTASKKSSFNVPGAGRGPPLASISAILPPIGSALTRRLQQKNEPHWTSTYLRSFVLRSRLDHDRIDGSAEEERMETNCSSRYTASVGGIDDGRLPCIVNQLTQLRVALRNDGEAHDVRLYRAVVRGNAVHQLYSELV